MNVSEVFIRKPIMTVLVTVAAVIFGVVAYRQLPISDLPSVDYPVITISVGYPGASPATMASAVAAPLENECMQIEGLQTVLSDNAEGYTAITLTFDLNRSTDLATPDVQAAISRAQGNLPSDLPSPPTFAKNNPSDKPILYMVLSSETMTDGELYDYGNKRIGQQISMISGVSKVQVYGAKRAMRIQVDPEKLASLGIGVNELAVALSSGTVTIPAGSLNGPDRSFSIEPKGQLFQASEYEELIVAYRNGAPVRLREVATVVEALNNDVIRVLYGKDGRPMKTGALCMAVSRQAGANTVALSDRIRAELKSLEKQLPGSARIEVFYDKAVSIRESVADVKTTILIALALVVLVIFLFLGRAGDTIIPAIVLPISIASTFIIMWALGFSLDNLSLMGITLSVGFLVDDSIVVLENNVRHVQEGKKPLAAAILSAKEITFTVVSTSLALVIVFVPLVFMQGVVGRNFKEFAITVVAAIFCSTVLALTLSPMMCARMVKASGEKKNRLQRFTDWFEGGMKAHYAVALRWVLRHRIVSVAMWLACIGGTVWLFGLLPKSFMPMGDSGLIVGQLMAPQGTSTRQMRDFQDGLARILEVNTNLESMLSISGTQAGSDQSTAPFFVALKPHDARAPIMNVAMDLTRRAMALPNGYTFLMPMPALLLSAGGESTASGSKYSYVLSGADRDELYAAAQRLEARMRQLPGFIGVQSSVKLDMPQLELVVNRDRASSLGLTAKDIEYALSLAYAQGRVTTFKTDVDQYDVIVEVAGSSREVPDNLARLYVRSGEGKLVPLASVVDWRETIGPQSVPHRNQLNAATLSFNLTPETPIGDATKRLEQAAAEVVPVTIGGQFQGEAQEFEEAVSSLVVLLLVSVFLMYVVLGILYESYIHPFTVLTTLPVAAFGGLLTLLIFKAELSLYAYIGMFMLLGIVAKNGIMMVDFANQLLSEKRCSDLDAIYEACLIRFRPILMTGVSSIVGALPIALGFGADGSSRIPLGLIIVGGLIFAQVITLFVTPGIFLYMQQVQRGFLDRFELSRSGATRHGEG